MRLLELQRRMAAAMMVPLTPSGNIAKSVAAEASALIKPNDRLSSLNRLEIYSRSYWFRLLDSFREDFPGLLAVLGSRAFDCLSEAYLREVPSRSFTLRNLGSRLPDWLLQHPQYAGTNQTLALDMARLEWAHIEAFDGRAGNAAGPEDLLELRPEMKFALQPYLSLLDLNFPVDDLRLHIRELAVQQGAASNTVIRQRERSTARRYRRIAPAPIFVAVHRQEYSVFYKRIEAGEFRILRALQSGQSLGQALEAVSNDGAEDCTASLERWFASWSRLGWLCVPERENHNETD